MFSGPDVLNITVGVESIYEFNVTEDNDDTVTVHVNGSLPGTYHIISLLIVNRTFQHSFRWTIHEPTADILRLTFMATDSLDFTGTWSPRLEVCACANGGNCTRDSGIPPHINILSCDCHPGTIYTPNAVFIEEC